MTAACESTRLLQAAVRAERERIAETLHATTCQDLTGAYWMISVTAQQRRKFAPQVEQKLLGFAKNLRDAGRNLKLVVHSLESDEKIVIGSVVDTKWVYSAPSKLAEGSCTLLGVGMKIHGGTHEVVLACHEVTAALERAQALETCKKRSLWNFVAVLCLA